jgi:hypothetical protein
MGNMVNVSSSEQTEELAGSTQLRIVLDLGRPVSHHVNQLLFWSLEEIRNIYAPFRKRKSSPVLSRSEFLRFVRLSRISAFHIYDELCKQGRDVER